jgi:endonuclease YncB( thermonuclease family)
MITFKIIHGTFHVKGFSPDGDSIRFAADNPVNWDFFHWSTSAKKKAVKKQLRIEAIDALETHYEGYHQPRSFAVAALERMLGYIGIGGVKYSLSVAVIVDAADGTPGYIASASVDCYDRPVSFVFGEVPGLADGAEVSVNELPLNESINYRLAKDGLVYPTFYTTTDRAIAERFRAAVADARIASRGIWAIDRTPDFTLWDTRTIQDDALILPKLFRRIVSFFDARGDIDELPAYLNKQKDRLKLWSGGSTTSLDKLLVVEGRRLRLATPVEDLLFSPKG